MKLLGSVIVASTIAKNHEKSCVGQKCGCNSEEMMRWKNEMREWKHDQESKFTLKWDSVRLGKARMCRICLVSSGGHKDYII